MAGSLEKKTYTDDRVLGTAGLSIRQQIVACTHVPYAYRYLFWNKGIHIPSRWAYPRACSRCSLANSCREFLMRSYRDIGNSLSNISDQEEVVSGWPYLNQVATSFRSYRKIDSMER